VGRFSKTCQTQTMKDEVKRTKIGLVMGMMRSTVVEEE
jgi:hypothetical protein